MFSYVKNKTNIFYLPQEADKLWCLESSKAGSWMSPYLNNQTQYLEVTNLTKERLTKGGALGSILGPMYFIVYYNDLLKIFEKHIHSTAYADDITLVTIYYYVTIYIFKCKK